MSEKWCSGCRQTKSTADFYVRGDRNGISSARCKLCMGAARVAWEKKNPDKARRLAEEKRVRNRALNDATDVHARGRNCTACGLNKAGTEFARSRAVRGGLVTICKPCSRARRMLKTWGLTPEKYRLMLAAQDFKCPICWRHLDLAGKTHVDHCHRTGSVRGLLCVDCNIGLGHFRDRPDCLRNAIEYVSRPAAPC